MPSRNTISMPSLRKRSMQRVATGKGNTEVNNVRNHEDAYIDVWNDCDWKCACSSGRSSCTRSSSWNIYRPSSAIDGLYTCRNHRIISQLSNAQCFSFNAVSYVHRSCHAAVLYAEQFSASHLILEQICLRTAKVKRLRGDYKAPHSQQQQAPTTHNIRPEQVNSILRRSIPQEVPPNT